MNWKNIAAVVAIIIVLIATLLYPTQYTNIRVNSSLKVRPWQESNTQFLHGKNITNNTTGNNEEYEDIIAPYGHSWIMDNPFTDNFNVSYIVSRLYLEPHIGSDIRVDGSMGDKAAFNISFSDVNHDHIADLIVGAPYTDWPSNITTVYDEDSSSGTSSYPFNTDRSWVRLQMLYLKSDIPTTGIIDKIYFYKTTSGKTGIFKNFRIYIGEYSSDSLGSNLDTNNNSAINKKLVYKADEFTLSGNSGWFFIDVYNIFNYTGNNNLFIQISWNGCSGDTLYLKEKNRDGTNYYRAYAASGVASNSSANTDSLQYWMKLAITPWQKADCGATYIFFGYKNWSASHLTAEDANWTIYGEMGHDHFGWSVDGLDFNGDWNTRDDVIIGAPNASVAQIRPGKMYIFYGGRFDEFENSSWAQGWTYSSTGVGVTTTKYYKGKQSLRFYDSGTTVYKYAYRSIPNYKAGILELFVNLNWTGGNFFITLKSGSNDVMKIEFRNNGFIYYYNSTGSYPLMSKGYSANTWYWIKFDYDCGRGTYDIYINNTLVKSGIDFINSASSIDTLDLRTATSTKVTVYCDQISTTPGYVIGVGEFDGDKYGFSVSYAGDTNYDGIDDAVVGAPGYNNNTGKTYVYFGDPENSNTKIKAGKTVDSYKGSKKEEKDEGKVSEKKNGLEKISTYEKSGKGGNVKSEFFPGDRLNIKNAKPLNSEDNTPHKGKINLTDKEFIKKYGVYPDKDNFAGSFAKELANEYYNKIDFKALYEWLSTINVSKGKDKVWSGEDFIDGNPKHIKVEDYAHKKLKEILKREERPVYRVELLSEDIIRKMWENMTNEGKIHYIVQALYSLKRYEEDYKREKWEGKRVWYKQDWYDPKVITSIRWMLYELHQNLSNWELAYKIAKGIKSIDDAKIGPFHAFVIKDPSLIQPRVNNPKVTVTLRLNGWYTNEGDQWGDPDPYFHIYIGSNYWSTGTYDETPYWQGDLAYSATIGTSSVGIHIVFMEDDSPWSDDHFDIDPSNTGDSRDFDATYYLDSKTWYGDLSPNGGSPPYCGYGNGNGDGNGEVFFNVQSDVDNNAWMRANEGFYDSWTGAGYLVTTYSSSYYTVSTYNDADDYWHFYITSEAISKGGTIHITMDPNNNANFDLYLYDAAGNLKASSTSTTNGAVETITYTLSSATDSAGSWYIDIRRVSGYGNYTYTFDVEYDAPFNDDFESTLLPGWFNGTSYALYEPWEANSLQPSKTNTNIIGSWWTPNDSTKFKIVSSTATGLSAAEGSYMLHIIYDANNADYTLRTASKIDLTGSSTAYVFFYITGSSESGYDYLYFQISTDGSSWTNLLSVSGDYSSGWYYWDADLSSYAGQKVYLRFEFKTDSSVISGYGWYIDYLYVVRDDVWHLQTTNYHSSNHAYYYGFDSGTYYSNYFLQYILSPKIDLSGITADYVYLSYYEKYNTESSYDYCQLWVYNYSSNGWTRETIYSGSQTSWTERFYNITKYKGYKIMLGFCFAADYSANSTYDGWWIDDVRIYGVYKITFKAVTVNAGTPMDSSNYVTVTYYRCGWQKTAHIYDGYSVTDYVDAGSSYSYTQTSSASTSTHRWYSPSPPSGTASSSTTITGYYYEQYLITFYAWTKNTGTHTNMSSGNTADVTYTYCGVTQHAYPYDYNSVQVWADCGSSYSYSQTSTGSTSTHRWYSPSPPSGTVSSSTSITGYYWEQYYNTVKYTKGNGAGCTHTTSIPVTYYHEGNSATGYATESGNTYWIDVGSTLTYTNPYNVGTNERWASVDTTSFTVSSYTTYNPTYYHQWKVTFKYTVGNANCTATPPSIPVTYTHEGTSDTAYATTSGNSYWVDCASSYSYTNPYDDATYTGDRWYSQDSSVSGTISSSTTINPTYYHQWQITLGVISYGTTSLSSTNYATVTYKATNSWTSENLWSQNQITRWVDCGEYVKFSEKSSSSDNTHRWYNPTPRQFYIDESNHPTSVNEDYYEQWWVTFAVTTQGSTKLSSTNYVRVEYDFCGVSRSNTTNIIYDENSVTVWVDDVGVDGDDDYNYSSPSSASTSTHRWYSSDTVDADFSGTVASSTIITCTYWEQWNGNPTFKTTSHGTNSLDSTNYATVTYYFCGQQQSVNVWDTQPATVWVDDSSTYTYSHYVYDSSNSNHRWWNPSPYSGTYTGGTINEDYYEQWKVTFAVSTVGTTKLSSTNYVRVEYDFCGVSRSNRTNPIYDGNPVSVWIDDVGVDGDDDYNYSSPSSASTSTHRWYSSDTVDPYFSGSVASSTTITCTYWEQWHITLTAHVVNTALGNKSLDSTNYVWGNYSWCGNWNSTHLYDGYSQTVWIDDGNSKVIYSHKSKESDATHRWYAPSVTYDSNSATQSSGIDCAYYEQYLGELSTQTLPSGAPQLDSTNYAVAWIIANATNETVSPLYDSISPVCRWIDNNTYVIFKEIIYDASNNIRWVAESPWKHKVNSLGTRTITQNYWCQYKNVVGVYIINDESVFPNDVQITYYQINQPKYLYLGNGKRKEWAEIWADYNSQITWQTEPYNNSQKRLRIDDDAVNPEVVNSYGNNWTKYYYHQYYVEFRIPKNVGSCSDAVPAFSLTTRWNLGDNDGGQSGNSYWVDNNTTYQYENPHYVSPNERWYISSANYSALIDGSYFIVQPDCYHQWNVTFKYRKLNYACPHSTNIPFNYSYLGSTQTGYASESGNYYWVDCGSTYDYYNPYYDSSISRWKSTSTNTTGTITSSGKIEPYYYHQIEVNFIPQKGNGAGCPHSLPAASNFKLNYTADGNPYTDQPFGTYWIDCGSTVEYQSYYNSTIDRWYPEVLSESVTSGGDHYVKFFHQWKITFSATTVNAGTPMDSSNYVTVSYTSTNNSQNAHIWDGNSITVWADCSSQFIYSQESSASTSQHRWITNEALTGIVSYTNATNGVSKNYYEQVYLTMDNGGHDIGYSEGELFGSSHSALGPGSSWYDVGCTVTIKVDSPVGGAWIRYRFDHWEDGSGNTVSSSNPFSFTMPSADGITRVAVWVTQYKLAVRTQGVSPPNFTAVYINGLQEGNANDYSPFYKWYDAGSSTGTIGVDAYVGGYYVRSYFDHWDDGTTANPHASITMNSPMNLTAIYIEKYRLIVATSGLPSSFPTKLWINGVYITTIYDGNSYSAWYDAGSSTGNITVQNVVITGGRFDYHFVYWNDWSTNHDHPSIIMNSPITLIAKYIMGIMFNVTIVGINEGDYFGWTVSDAGNVNETSSQQPIKDDIIIGSPGWNNWQGRAYIFYGSFLKWKASQSNKSIYLRDTNANVTLVGENQGDKFGWSVSYAGDLNNDGYDDVIVGAPGYNNGQGRSYVYYGNANMDNGGSSTKTTYNKTKEKSSLFLENYSKKDGKIKTTVKNEKAGKYIRNLTLEYFGKFNIKFIKSWVKKQNLNIATHDREFSAKDFIDGKNHFIEEEFAKRKMMELKENGRRSIYRVELISKEIVKEEWSYLKEDVKRWVILHWLYDIEDYRRMYKEYKTPYLKNWYDERYISTLEYLCYRLSNDIDNYSLAYIIGKGIKSIDDAMIGPFNSYHPVGSEDKWAESKASKSPGSTVTLQLVHFSTSTGDCNGAPDMYFDLTVGSWTFTTTTDGISDSNFNCKFIHTNSNVSGSTVTVSIHNWESDSFLCGSDDDFGSFTVTYYLTTKTWSGATSTPYASTSGADGSGEDWFVIESDEDNEAKMGDYDRNYANEPYTAGSCFNDPWDEPTRVTYYGGGNYWGYGYYNHNYYEFYVSSGTTISVHMIPSNYNYDLYLYDPSGTQKASSTNTGTTQDDITFTADSTGYWKIDIYATDGYADWFRFWFTSGPDDKNYLSVATTGSVYYGYLISTYNTVTYYDSADYYKIYISPWQISHGASILVYMKPNNNADFNLYLYDPSGNLKKSSTNSGNGQYESVLYDLQSSDSAGYWYFKVDIASGYGNYSLLVWFGFRVEFHAVTANSGSHEPMHSDNGVQVSYVQMGYTDYVYPNDDYYWIVYVDNGSSYSYVSQSNLSGSTHRWYSPNPPSGTITSSTSIIGYYYEQYYITVNAQKGNGAGCTDTLPTSSLHYSYYQFGNKYTNGNYGSATWIDNGSVVQVIDYYVSSTERWACDPTQNSVTVTSGNTITFTYYHQWSVNFKIIIKSPDGVEPTNGIAVHYSQFGSGKTQNVSSTIFTDWVDCGSSYSYDNPVPSNPSTERWYSQSSNVSGSISSSMTIAPFYFHQYWVTIKFTIGNDNHCSDTTAIPVSWQYMGSTNNTYAYTSDTQTWVDGGSKVVFTNPYVITANAERWFSPDNASGGNVEYTISSSMICNPTYWHQWYVTAKTTGGYLDATYSTTLYYNQTGITNTQTIYDSSPWTGWVDCGSQLKVDSPVNGPSSPRTVRYVCDFPLVYVSKNGTYTFLFHAEFPADVKIDGGKQGDMFGYAVDGSIVINNTVSVVIGAPGNNTIYVFYWNSSWGIGTVINVGDSSENYSGEYSSDMYGFSVIGRNVDFNDDGTYDIAVGAPYFNSHLNDYRGRAYILRIGYPKINVSFWYTTDNGATWNILGYYIIENLNSAGWYNSTPIYVHKTVPAGGKIAINITVVSDYGSPMVRVYYNSTQHNSHYEIKAVTLDNWQTIGSARTQWVRTYWQDGSPTNQWIARYSKTTNTSGIIKANVSAVAPYTSWMINGAKIKIIDMDTGSVIIDNATMNLESTGTSWKIYTYSFDLSTFTAGDRYIVIVTAIDIDGFDDWVFGPCDERSIQFYVVS